MKYGESFFDIAYLVFAVTCGCIICYFAGFQVVNNIA